MRNNITEHIQPITQRIKRYLSGDRLIFIISIITASFLWISSQLSKELDRNLDLKIQYESPKKYTLASEVPTALYLNVKGLGWSLLFSELKNNATWNILLPNKKELIYSESDLIKALKKDFNVPNIEILKIRPSLIIVKQDNLFRKSIPLKADFHIDLNAGFIVKDQPIISPSNVEIQGPEQMLTSISEWPLGNIEIHQIENELILKQNVSLETSNSLLSIEPKEVKISATLEQITEQVVSVPIEMDTINTPIERVFPKEVKVKLLLGLSKYDNFKKEDIILGIKVDSSNHSNTYEVNIIKSPRDITIEQIIPAYVDVYFKQG